MWGVYANDIGIHSWDKNDPEKNPNLAIEQIITINRY